MCFELADALRRVDIEVDSPAPNSTLLSEDSDYNQWRASVSSALRELNGWDLDDVEPNVPPLRGLFDLSREDNISPAEAARAIALANSFFA